MYSWYLNHRKNIWLLLLVALYLITPAIFFWLLGWTLQLAPLLLILVLQIGGLLLFLAKSGVKCLYPEEIDITFANVKGLGDTLDDLKQIPNPGRSSLDRDHYIFHRFPGLVLCSKLDLVDRRRFLQTSVSPG